MAQYLPPNEVAAIIQGDSAKPISVNNGTHLTIFVPKLVDRAISCGKLTAPQIVELIEDRERFKKFADHLKANPGNRSKGAQKLRHKP